MDIELTPLEDWGLPYNELFLCAGPCSAETEDQVMATAKALSKSGISLFRAGLWKPRTRPGSFEGVGLAGIEWLVRARRETGLSVGVEVATPEHVEACLKHKIDVVWIGARTTPNPFAIQELADALKGTDIPVMIKNPISPDIELWIGAIERIYNAGIRKIAAIHRGFSSSRQDIYRNPPKWRIPIELKRRIPQIPIICDPSHICGKTELLFTIAQEALDLLYNGLMIEVHVNPSEALSDARQQVTPVQFDDLIRRLTLKTELPDDSRYRSRISELRQEVDHLDSTIIEILGKRMRISEEMAKLKKENNVSTLQPSRWKEILKDRIIAGLNENLSEDHITQVFQAIHEESIRHQEGLLNPEK